MNTSFLDLTLMSGYIFSTSTVGSRTVPHRGHRCASSSTSILHCPHLLIVHPVTLNLHIDAVLCNLPEKPALHRRVSKIIAEREHQRAAVRAYIALDMLPLRHGKARVKHFHIWSVHIVDSDISYVRDRRRVRERRLGVNHPHSNIFDQQRCRPRHQYLFI